MKLGDIAQFIYSKNAGPYLITFDSVFSDEDAYAKAVRSGAFTKPRLASLFGVSESRIVSIHTYDAGRVIKFTMTREISSGDFGDRSVFGSQQWAPLLDLELECEGSVGAGASNPSGEDGHGDS
jgi:hypothetical protein